MGNLYVYTDITHISDQRSEDQSGTYRSRNGSVFEFSHPHTSLCGLSHRKLAQVSGLYSFSLRDDCIIWHLFVGQQRSGNVFVEIYAWFHMGDMHLLDSLFVADNVPAARLDEGIGIYASSIPAGMKIGPRSVLKY